MNFIRKLGDGITNSENDEIEKNDEWKKMKMMK